MKMTRSIGFKLSAASTLLVALVVAFMGYVNAVEIRRLHAERAADMTRVFDDQIASRAQSTATILSVALAEALEGTELGTLAAVVHGLVARDPQVLHALVVDAEGRVLADSARELEAASLPTYDPPDGGALLTPSRQSAEVDGHHIYRVRQPILGGDAGGAAQPHGAVVVSYDLAPLDEALAHVEADRKERTRAAMRSTVVVGGLALLAGILLSLFQGLRFARPIRRMARTAAVIASGDLSARVRVQGDDELSRLAERFNVMAEHVEELLVESVSKAELEHELNLARDIQSVLVPSPGLHAVPGMELAGYYEPAETCGGDFWDFAPLPHGCSTVLIGDVTGHGVPAAMLTATAKASLDTLRHVQGDALHVSETLRVLDHVIRDAGAGSFFMTASCAFLDSRESVLFFSSAGHPPALHLRWAEKSVKLTRLVSRGNRLGDGDPSGFEAHRRRVVQGDLLVWYTDGIVEAADDEGRPYGVRRLLRSLSKLTAETAPDRAVELLIDDFMRFRDGRPLEDDVTLVVGRIL